MIKILGKTTSFNENKEIEKIVAPISTLQDDFKIQFPLTSISPLEDGEYRFKIGIRLEKECDDSVFYEVMINNSIFLNYLQMTLQVLFPGRILKEIVFLMKQKICY